MIMLKSFLILFLPLHLFGAIIVAGVPNSFQTVNPTTSVTAHTRYALQLIFENLVRVNLQQELEPALAKMWKVNSNNNEIIFNLNEDHYFSDGENVTAHDVVSSFKIICSKESKARSELKGLKGCLSEGEFGAKAISKYILSLKTEIHPSILLHQLANLRVLVFKYVGGEAIGSGLYYVKKLDENSLVLTPNKFNPMLSTLKNEGVIFKFYPTEDKLMNALIKNEIHLSFVHLVSSDNKELEKNYNLIVDLPYITQILVFNNQRVPFNDKSLRLALYDEIQKNVERISKCRQIGSKPAFGIIPQGLGGSIAHVKNKYENRISVKVQTKGPIGNSSVTIHQHKGRENLCEADILKEIFKKFSLTLNIQYHESYDSLWPLYLNHNLDGFIELFNFKNREAYSILTYFLSDGNNENYANIKDKKLDTLITSALKSLTVSERFSLYRDANAYIHREAYVAPLYYSTTKNYYHKCLKGVFHKPSFNPFPGIAGISLSKDCNILSK